LFSIASLRHWRFTRSWCDTFEVRYVGPLMIVLIVQIIQIFSWFWQWKNLKVGQYFMKL